MQGESDARMADDREDGEASLLAMVLPLVEHLKVMVLLPLVAGLVAVAISFAVAPTYTAQTSFLPPQQGQSSAAAALASLGSLASLAGGAGAVRSPADQYVALMTSVTVSDRLIDRFKLIEAYEAENRTLARRELARRARISVGKKDGLIVVTMDDTVPQRAAEIANAYVDELRRLTSTIAISEAQQRRVFFERQMTQTRDRLAQAQTALQSSGFSQGALRAEPKAAAESYARLRAEVTAAEVRLQALRGSFSDSAPEVTTQLNTLSGLRAQLARLEQATAVGGDADYVGRYRDFKYQEALFELFARQYELARVDESREGALIQVVDVAGTPELKSKPRRAVWGIVATLGTLLLLVISLLARQAWRSAASDPRSAATVQQIRSALGRS